MGGTDRQTGGQTEGSFWVLLASGQARRARLNVSHAATFILFFSFELCVSVLSGPSPLPPSVGEL